MDHKKKHQQQQNNIKNRNDLNLSSNRNITAPRSIVSPLKHYEINNINSIHEMNMVNDDISSIIEHLQINCDTMKSAICENESNITRSDNIMSNSNNNNNNNKSNISNIPSSTSLTYQSRSQPHHSSHEGIRELNLDFSSAERSKIISMKPPIFVFQQLKEHFPLLLCLLFLYPQI